MKYIEIVLLVGFMAVAFFLGYNWALKRNPIITTDAEKKAASKLI